MLLTPCPAVFINHNEVKWKISFTLNMHTKSLETCFFVGVGLGDRDNRGSERESQAGSLPYAEPNTGLDLTTLIS